MKKLFVFCGSYLFVQIVFSQNIGIGTNNPTRAKLEVHGAAGATSAIFGGESTGISLQRNWPGIGFNSYYNNGHRNISNGFGAIQFFDPSNGYMAIDMFANGLADNLSTINRRAMVITNDGRVGIGSANYPPATLYVARGNAVDGTAVFQGSNHRSHFNYGAEENTYIRAGRTNGTVFINDIPGSKVVLSGNVGINTANPSSALEILLANSTGLTLVEAMYYNHWEFLVSSHSTNLNLYFTNKHLKGYFQSSNGDYHAFSDRRLKTNIQSLPSLLDKIVKLQAVTYEPVYDNPHRKKSIGFIAQDVKALFPELVGIVKDTVGAYKGIDDLHTLSYSSFGVLAVKAIQEQQAMLQVQEQKINAQQKSIDALHDELKAIKRLMKETISTKN